MANHPNRKRFTANDIRAYLMARHDAEQVMRGDEVDDEQHGAYAGDESAWLVLGVMPNTNQTDWFFAGWTADVVRDMRNEANR
jgi:hypothetical protein